MKKCLTLWLSLLICFAIDPIIKNDLTCFNKSDAFTLGKIYKKYPAMTNQVAEQEYKIIKLTNLCSNYQAMYEIADDKVNNNRKNTVKKMSISAFLGIILGMIVKK